MKYIGQSMFVTAMRMKMMPVLRDSGARAQEELFEVMRLNACGDTAHESVSKALLGWFSAEGGLYTKMGQAYAEQPEMSRGALQDAFRRMQTYCPTVDAAEIKRIIQSEIDAKRLPADVVPLHQLHEEPLGAGSVAQVHRCGENLVVKVAMRGNRDLMEMQNQTLQQLAKDKILSKTPIADVAQLAGGSVPGFLREFDMDIEAQNMKKVTAHSEGFTNRGRAILPVRVPKVHASSPAVLVMTYEAGRLYHELPKEEQLRALQTIFDFCGQCIFHRKLAYCDVHPGNLMLTAGCQELVILDWGMVVHLTDQEHAALKTIFRNLPGPDSSEEQEEAVLKQNASVLARAMRGLGFATENDTDEGLALLALHAFDSNRPAALQAMKAKSYGSQEDPPAFGKTFPPSIAAVLRLRSMLGGLKAQLKKRYDEQPLGSSSWGTMALLKGLTTLNLWREMASSS